MTNNSLYTIAERANSIASSTEEGFVSCVVNSTNPPILKYTFLTAENAMKFKLRRDLAHTSFVYELSKDNLSIVFENR